MMMPYKGIKIDELHRDKEGGIKIER